MATLSRRILLPLVAFLLSVVALGGVAVFTFLPSSEHGTAAIGGPFSLTAQDGRIVTEKALLGGPSLIFFGFTHCPDVCPTALYEITQLYTALGPQGDRMKAFFITVDPERDTADFLRDYLTSFDPRIVGLTGSPEAVQTAMRAYRAFARKVPLEGGNYTMDHTALVYLMNREGRFVSSINFDRPPEENAKLVASHF